MAPGIKSQVLLVPRAGMRGSRWVPSNSGYFLIPGDTEHAADECPAPQGMGNGDNNHSWTEAAFLLQLWNMALILAVKSQSMELINGNRSSSELHPEGAQVCGCFSSPRPRDPRAGICTRAGKQPGPTEALLIPCLCGTAWEGEPGAPGNVITAEGLAESGGSFPY